MAHCFQKIMCKSYLQKVKQSCLHCFSLQKKQASGHDTAFLQISKRQSPEQKKVVVTSRSPSTPAEPTTVTFKVFITHNSRMEYARESLRII